MDANQNKIKKKKEKSTHKVNGGNDHNFMNPPFQRSCNQFEHGKIKEIQKAGEDNIHT